MIRHILLSTFNAQMLPAQIAALRCAFLAISHQISGVMVVVGTNDSP